MLIIWHKFDKFSYLIALGLSIIWLGFVFKDGVSAGSVMRKDIPPGPTQVASVGVPPEVLSGTDTPDIVEDIQTFYTETVSNDDIADYFSYDDEEETGGEDNLYLVARVVDGDTIDAENIGRIRMIGVDTPETVDPRKPVQCFGVEASNITKSMLSGQKVRLEIDPSQGDRDKYNRALRYVYLANGVFFNKWLIEEGFAHEYTYNIPYRYMDEFKEAENRARLGKRGLWSPEACSADIPIPAGSTPNQSDKCPIKGNINSSGDKIYHLPGGDYYEATKIDEARGEQWFCSEEEAVAAGWRKSKN